MDVIINLIIVLVVVFSILKRFQEVAQKGIEVKKPQNGRPQQVERIPSTLAEEPTVAADSAPPATPQWPQRRQTLQDIVEQLERGYRETLEPEPEPSFEVASSTVEDEFEGMTEEQFPVMPKLVSSMIAKRQTPAITATYPAIAFSGSTVVNGIIMGEILGPPVALRTGMDPHRLI